MLKMKGQGLFASGLIEVNGFRKTGLNDVTDKLRLETMQ